MTIIQKTGMHRGLPLTSRPEPEDIVRRFPDTGSHVVTIPATFPFGFQTWEGEVEVVGYGLEILRGMSGITHQASGTNPQTHTVSLTMLVGGETQTGALAGERTFQQGEIYEGAILPGRFERLRVRWTGTTNVAPNVPLTIRVFHQPLRVVPTATQKPLGLPVLDYFDGLLFNMPVVDAQLILYDDSVATKQPYLFRDAQPAIGTGLGGDFQQGPHYSFKRKLIGRVVFPVPVATDQYRVLVEGLNSAGNFEPWAFFAAENRPSGAASGWGSASAQIVTFSEAHADRDSDFGDLGSGLWVPGMIRIRAVTNTALAPILNNCSIWLSFVGAGG